MPQDGLSLCLSDPTAGQSQLCEQPASENLLPAGLRVDAAHTLRTTFSESAMCWAVWEDDSRVDSQCN